MRSSLIALLSLLVGLPSIARAGASVEDLKDLNQIGALCLAARPLSRVYLGDSEASRAKARGNWQASRTAAMDTLFRLSVPQQGFTLGDYRSRKDKLDLDLEKPLRAMHGAVAVIFNEDEPIALDMNGDQHEALLNALRKNEVTLVAYFQLDDGQRESCTGSTAGQMFTIAAVPAAFVLHDANGQILGRVELPRANRFRALIGGYRGTPTAVFGVVDADGADVTAFTHGLAVAAEPLRRCYAERLKARNDAGGTLVVGLSVDVKGGVESVTFIADALGDDPIRQCVDDQLHRLSFAGAAGLPALVRVPIEFKLVAQR